MSPETSQLGERTKPLFERVTDTLRGSNISTACVTIIASLSVHGIVSPDTAQADCVTTHTVETTPTGTTDTTTTVCNPDAEPTPPGTNNPPAAPETPHHHQPDKPPHHNQPNNPNGKDEYQNPFRAVMQNHSLKPYRIDEGVDYRGHGSVYAIGDGKVTEATSHSSFFANEGGQNTVYRLTSGKADGKSVFIGEACKPRPSLIGHKVTAKTVICHMHGDHFPGIETGWWNPHTDTPMAYPKYTPAGNPDGSKMAYGVNFSELLVSLGVPGGNTVHASDRMSTNPGRKVGKLPPNWPRW